MQKILDRTQESLAHAFASLEQSAKRQQGVYLATIASLMLIVVVFALALAVIGASKQLDYLHTYAAQNAAEFSLLLHREESFLRRTEFTLDFYQATTNVLHVPDSIEDSVRQTGVARGDIERIGAGFDVLIGEATRAAWGDELNAKLWRLYEAAQSALVTQQAFELRQRTVLLGLNEDYAAILPSVVRPDASGSPATPPLQAAAVGTLRATLLHELQTQTGKRLPGKGERVWLGPYRDPLQGLLVISAVSAYYDADGKPVALIAVSVPVETLPARLKWPNHEGAMLLMMADHRLIVSSPPLDAQRVTLLQGVVAHTPPDTNRYIRDGVIFYEPLTPGFGALVGYVTWRGLASALGWQLAVLAALTLLILLAIALIAHFWGLRLLRVSFAETSRALESETINHILVSATPIGLCIVRQSDHSILTANALAKELLHIEPDGERLPSHIVDEFRAQATDKPSAHAFAKIAAFVVPALPPQATPTPPPTASHPDERPAAPGRFLQLTYAPARYDDQDVLFCAILDVTAQYELEQQLRLAHQTSENMMRARSNFFASMSHEIRTPLNALLGNLELFARTPGLDAHTQRLATLGVAANALRGIVNDILDFSKIDAGEMRLATELFRPVDDLENIALSCAPMKADRPIRFYSHLSPTLDQPLRGARTRIAQIVNNLLSNAFKFTSCGKIVLSAEIDDDPQGNPILICRVCDSGIGMDQALVARIFNPFVQGEASTSSRYGGTGLGLSICARLCELMGGHISVESVLGVGSAFTVALPLALPPEESRTATVEAPRRGHALVLCQERESGQLLETALQRKGWSVHTETSMRGAQAWLRVNRPDVLVVTGEYGLDAVAELREAQAIGTVWITYGGPHMPALRGDGIFEVSEFSRKAVMSAIDLATGGPNARAASVAAPVDPVVASPQPVHAALHGLKVLVAEDNPLIQSLIVEQLIALGCSPTIAGDGRQALAAAERAHFDVLLSDIHMPVMDGYELLAQVSKSHPDLPVLAFSAVTDTQDDAAWRERGFTGHVAKPASLGELEAALLEVVSARAHGVEPATEMETETGAADAPVSTLSADDKARYNAMLRQHLQSELPRLMAIVEAEDREALGGWAHSAGGALLIVQEAAFAQQCRELQQLCRGSERWTVDMDERAISLHDTLIDHFGLDE
ncbi:Sensor histidine kinase RcsC [Burkholderia sp. AD24]|nr:Sensor histidine kinase RcsC [Burkholderia sp. AD24]